MSLNSWLDGESVLTSISSKRKLQLYMLLYATASALMLFAVFDSSSKSMFVRSYRLFLSVAFAFSLVHTFKEYKKSKKNTK
jgi:hypothetical protein